MTTFVPFKPEHLDVAAGLLAARHRRDREREPLLPPRFEDPAQCRQVLEKLLATPHSGVLAIRDGSAVGYMIGRLGSWRGQRSAHVGLSAMALAAGEELELQREMYAVAAPAWLRQGYFVHTVNVLASDAQSLEGWYSLGFARDGYLCVRDLSPVTGAESEVVVRRAGPDDLDSVRSLNLGLGRYNATSPLFRPFILPAPEEMDRWRDRLKEDLLNERASHWLAYVDGNPIGLMVFVPPPDADALDSPDGAVYLSIAYIEEVGRLGGMGTAMLNRGLAWARESGYELCTVGFFTTNIIGARFWRSKGFQPVSITLQRTVDERIAWADGKQA